MAQDGHENGHDGREDVREGLPLRDLFAALAMAGIATASDTQVSPKLVAARAYALADAMLSERTK